MSSQLRIRTKIKQQDVSVIYHEGAMVPFLFRGGKIVHANKPVDLPQMAIRMSSDGEGEWMEVGFLSTMQLVGDAANGWVDPGNYVAIQLQNSIDLVNWNLGNFIPAPSGGEIDNLDGTWWYWSRSTLPRFWNNTLIDNRLETDRYGKSITELRLGGVAVSLPNYPYVMPADAATLQADLIAEGYTGSLVTSTSAPISASIINHNYTDFYNRAVLTPTIDGSGQVTDVIYNFSSIPLPSYPYALPSQAATLQSDLRAAGYSGAVVKLHGDIWEIFVPDRNTTTGESRKIAVTITPTDPFPYWDLFGTYQGEDPDDVVDGDYENLRLSGGSAAEEATKQFARMLLTAGTRYDTP